MFAIAADPKHLGTTIGFIAVLHTGLQRHSCFEARFERFSVLKHGAGDVMVAVSNCEKSVSMAVTARAHAKILGFAL
jgi:hypothetical protein